MADTPPLDQPMEIAIRGDRVDILGFLAGVNVVLGDHADELGGTEGRGGKVAQQVMERIDQKENLALFRREAEKAIERGDVPGFRGVDVAYRPFDPRHPEPDLDIEVLPPLDEAEHYLVFTLDEDGFAAAGYPPQKEPLVGFAFASFLRTYARDLEDTIEADVYGVDDER